MRHGRNFASSISPWQEFTDLQEFTDFQGGAAAREARVRLPRDRPSTGDTSASVPLPNKYISGDPGVADANEYNVQINFVGSWTSDLRQAFITCAEPISDIILGDIP